jgi:hypothetical protein
MVGNKKKPAGKGKAAPKRAKAKPKAKVVAKAKTSAKKGAAKPAAKKPAAKKPAAKKPAAKQAAAKKPAAKQAAPKKSPAKVQAKAKPAAAKAKAKPASTPKPSKPAGGGGALLQTEILAMARQVYGDRSDAQLLALDPNEIDEMDPATFYEMISEKYGVEGDPADSNFGGFGGPIEKLIEFVGSRWDGKTRGDAPMPPQEWLDEFVHPATERVPEQAEPLDEPLLD